MKSIPDDEKLKRTKGVMGVVRAGGQYQVVIGSDVPNVYNEINKIGGFDKGGGNADKKDERSGFVRALDTLARFYTYHPGNNGRRYPKGGNGAFGRVRRI